MTWWYFINTPLLLGIKCESIETKNNIMLRPDVISVIGLGKWFNKIGPIKYSRLSVLKRVLMHNIILQPFFFGKGSLCCGQLWVWHMFCDQCSWWAMPPNKSHGSGWDTIWVPADHVNLCQTHCKQVPDFSRAQGHVVRFGPITTIVT